MLPGEEIVAREVAEHLGKHLARLDAMTECIMACFDGEGLTFTTTEDLDPMVLQVAAAYLNKACQTSRAIGLVAARGLEADSAILLRALFEAHLAIRWLLAESSLRRARMFHAHASHCLLKEARGLLSVVPEAGQARAAEAVRLAQEQIDRWKEVLGAEVVDAVRRHWSGLRGVQEVARQLAATAYYESLYRQTSSHVHSSDPLQHLESADRDGAVLRLGPDGPALATTLKAAALLLGTAALTVDERIELGCRVRLSALLKELDEAVGSGGE